MAQQISESELVLMKIIWKNGGTALYSLIMKVNLPKILITYQFTDYPSSSADFV